MDQVAWSPLEQQAAVVEPRESAPGGLSYAASADPAPPCRHHVANPWTEEPDAGNPHVRIRGSPGSANSRGHPSLLELRSWVELGELDGEDGFDELGDALAW